MELKICISPQFRAIDPPNPARGFIQQNENVRFATAACMQKYGNVSFATVACAKCMRYGGRGGGPIPWGGGGGGVATRDTEPYIYICIYIYNMYSYIYLEPVCPLFWGFNPPKEGPFQSKEGSFGFQVYIYIYTYIMMVKSKNQG